MALYADLLHDLEIVAVTAAVRDLLLSEDRTPSIARIRRKVAEQAGVLAPSAGQAWGEVTRCAAEYGRGAKVPWSHPAIAETVRAIGWYEICMSTNQETLRAQFTRIYEDAQQRFDRSVVTEPGRLSLGDGADRRPEGATVALSVSPTAATGRGDR